MCIIIYLLRWFICNRPGGRLQNYKNRPPGRLQESIPGIVSEVGQFGINRPEGWLLLPERMRLLVQIVTNAHKSDLISIFMWWIHVTGKNKCVINTTVRNYFWSFLINCVLWLFMFFMFSIHMRHLCLPTGPRFYVYFDVEQSI